VLVGSLVGSRLNVTATIRRSKLVFVGILVFAAVSMLLRATGTL
jgi:uncharacterized membrane protein YfcA